MIAECLDPLVQIIETCSDVVKHAKHVTINNDAVQKIALELSTDVLTFRKGVEWDAEGWHYSADAATYGPLTCQYIFVMDALNFCFWPTKDLEYDYLAISLRKVSDILL